MSTNIGFPILNLPKDLVEHTASFLDVRDINRFSLSCTRHFKIFRESMERSARAHRLLFDVLNINERRKERLRKTIAEEMAFSQRDSRKNGTKSIVLTRTRMKEIYWSFAPFTYQTTVLRREWNSISPLEAAAWNGDNFLVRMLLGAVPANQAAEAIRQLEGVRARSSTAENGAYLAPYYSVIRAYEDYLMEIPRIRRTNAWGDGKALITNLWNAQRKLPVYALQVYCDPIPFSPIPDFTKEPPRECRTSDETNELDIDLSEGITKGSYPHGAYGLRDSRKVGHLTYPQEDYNAVRELCRVIKEDLNLIIRLMRKDDVEPAAIDATIRGLHKESEVSVVPVVSVAPVVPVVPVIAPLAPAAATAPVIAPVAPVATVTTYHRRWVGKP